MRRKAFTLIELLTVMAITAVMLTLIVLPIFQSFNFTRTAQAFADAQDKARVLTDRIAREVGNAVSVRDSADTVAVIPGIGSEVLPYTKLDLISPAQGDPSDRDSVSGAFRNPKTGKYDPTLTRPIGDIRLPVAAGMTFTRWWVGLNRPLNAQGQPEPYNEPYTGLLMARNGGRDNLFVLRRAEIQPFIWRLRKDNAQGTLGWRPNLAYFRSDDKVNNVDDFDTRIIDLDDPYFFVPDGKYQPEGPGGRADDPGKNQRVANWAKASVVQTELSRYDMIRPAVKGSPPVLDTTATVKVIPLVQFRPSRVSNAPAAGSSAARPGGASEGLDQVGPDSFQTERGLWTNAIVRYYPTGTFSSGIEMASVNQQGGISINTGGYNSAGLDGINIDNPFELFDLLGYERARARGDAYPFTQAARVADELDLQNPALKRLWTSDESQRRLFTPFRVITATGRMVTSFPIEEVGTKLLGNRNTPNLPFVTTVEPNSPTLDSGTGAVLTPALNPTARLYDINKQFNYLWNAYPQFQGFWQRSLDLRWVPNADGTLSPLCPVAQAGEVRGFSFVPLINPTGGATNRVRITPGSEEIYGPDQNPGPGYGAIVRYMRVAENPGPNQYRINYADLPEPKNTDPNSPNYGKVDYSVLGFDTAGFDPAVYNANNFVSAVVQPRFKAGYIQFCSDPNVPLPPRIENDGARPGTITVRYRFQFNGPEDSFVVDHDTREIMQILLTIKNYPQSNAPNAQTITLKSTATLRNALR